MRPDGSQLDISYHLDYETSDLSHEWLEVDATNSFVVVRALTWPEKLVLKLSELLLLHEEQG